ncbi:MAG: CBS domain-containing protein [Nitrosopumilaceae archaeon]|nr:CBS domain-containing protein [Nitrosopumilaceae archaeon]NIU00859.1 CBS domain-containing protein [Nitrosopumilaceae archaeon]NIU87312.1 CBS domain-containing protein [Nitrosopumilaceae archaeon]NIV65840.1 CBS domain-containing protein [Nitrosopumilaceae archaeon]NIX61461.1 CBS domain-containing protein [Nitrosopumilaceae archaeon]
MSRKFTSPVISVNPESSILETLKKMQINFVKHIVIVTKEKPVGIVTERDINKFLDNDKTARAIEEIPIRHVMEKNVIVITDDLDDHFEQCASRMETFRIGSVVLVDENGRLLGIVTKTDVVKAYASVHGGKYKVKDFMSKKLMTCRRSDSLSFALNIMNKNEVSRLIVTDENGAPHGLITTNNFLTHSEFFSKKNTMSRSYLLQEKNTTLKVEDLLKNNVLKINQEEDLATASSMMIKNKISGIPVVDDNAGLVGLISKMDVVKAFSQVGPHEVLKSKYKELY